MRLFKNLFSFPMGMTLLFSALIVHPVLGQKINFGGYTTSQGLSISPGSGINFGNILAGSDSSVTITRENSAWIRIDGDATRDITIIVPYITYLAYGSGNQIPFACQFAYSNSGIADPSPAEMNAVEISKGVTVITIPMLQRTIGAPAPPPTPAHGGYTAPKATVYLFLNGTLGPIGNAATGSYTGMVNVYVNYSTY